MWAPWFPEAAVGGQGSHAAERWIVGATLQAAAESSPSDDLFARLIARGSYDGTAQKIDDDRHAFWNEGRLLFGMLPIAVENTSRGLRFGARGDFHFVDNTPTSIDRSMRLVGGLGLSYSDDDTHLAVLAGGHNSLVELDDDLPRLRGFDRDQLESRHHGLATAGTLQHGLFDWLIVAATGRVLFDENSKLTDVLVGAALDFPLSSPSRGGARPCLRISAEERYLDADVRSALPFIRDGFIRIELLMLFGPRSWRSYGY